MRQGVRRLTAAFAAALLCLAGPGCSIGGIRIEPIEKPPVIGPSGTEPVPPETDPSETELPETELPETEPPETAAPEPIPADPEPEPKPSVWVKYADYDLAPGVRRVEKLPCALSGYWVRFVSSSACVATAALAYE